MPVLEGCNCGGGGDSRSRMRPRVGCGAHALSLCSASVNIEKVFFRFRVAVGASVAELCISISEADPPRLVGMMDATLDDDDRPNNDGILLTGVVSLLKVR